MSDPLFDFGGFIPGDNPGTNTPTDGTTESDPSQLDSANTDENWPYLIPPFLDDQPTRMSDGTYCWNSDVQRCDALDNFKCPDSPYFNRDIIDGLIQIIQETSKLTLDLQRGLTIQVASIVRDIATFNTSIATSIQSRIDTIQTEVDEIHQTINLEIGAALAPILASVSDIVNYFENQTTNISNQNSTGESNVVTNISNPENIVVTHPGVVVTIPSQPPPLGGSPVVPEPGESKPPTINIGITIPKDAVKVDVNCLDKPKVPEPITDNPVVPECDVSSDPKLDGLLYWLTSECGIDIVKKWLEGQGVTIPPQLDFKTLGEAQAFSMAVNIKAMPEVTYSDSLDLPIPISFE